MMIYKTTKQFGTGRETPGQTFTKLEQAKKYVQQAAAADAGMKIQSIYRVYEFDDLLLEIDSSSYQSEIDPSSSNDASGKGQSSHFSPTPFATTAKPKGAVQHWKKDEDDDNND